MRVTIDSSGLKEVERGIAPPMARAVTIPFYLEGRQFVIYVAIGAFQIQTVATDAQLREAAEFVADSLELMSASQGA